MDILLGYNGLAVAFIIIAALHLYFIIYSKAKIVTKALIIPVVLWYSLTLFYIPGKLMGWPTSSPIPDNSRVLSMMFREPFKGRPGSIYILAVSYVEVNESNISEVLNPKHVFGYSEKNVPRFYRLPYKRELHKRLQEGEKQAKKKGGFLRIGKGKKIRKNDSWSTDEEIKIEIVNPKLSMPK